MIQFHSVYKALFCSDLNPMPGKTGGFAMIAKGERKYADKEIVPEI